MIENCKCREEVLNWISKRLYEMLQRPGMWGSLESVEGQIITLLEIRCLYINPEFDVIEHYHLLLRTYFPTEKLPLFNAVTSKHEFVKYSKRIIEEIQILSGEKKL